MPARREDVAPCAVFLFVCMGSFRRVVGGQNGGVKVIGSFFALKTLTYSIFVLFMLCFNYYLEDH